MSDDWAAGDLALCVRGAKDTQPCIRLGVSEPRTGAIYRVARVSSERFESGIRTALWLIGGPLNRHRVGGILYFNSVWPSSRFVKITPCTKIKGREVEKRRPVKVDA